MDLLQSVEVSCCALKKKKLYFIYEVLVSIENALQPRTILHVYA